MIRFDPELTEILVFDLEAYVPKNDRKRKSGASLAVNPFKPDHTLLGGVVCCVKPLSETSVPRYSHHWIWESSEEEVAASLYAEFSGVWKRVIRKRHMHADPVVAGIGISVFDLPFLLCKCLLHEIAPPEDIYETLCKFRVLDLSAAGIGFVKSGHPVLYPCTHNELADSLLGERVQKPTGKRVWDFVDEKQYPAIARRCEGEVREMAAIMTAMQTIS
jgi:hypothetical protein